MATTARACSARPARWFVIGRYSIIVILLLAAVFFWRPTSVLDLYTRARLGMAGARSGDTQAGPHRIHYIVAGSGRPVVLLHGLGGSSMNWASYIPALAQQGRVYAIDLLGFGDSDRPDVDYSVAIQTEALRNFLDAQQLLHTDLVGVSMGGIIAGNFARQYPERVRRLALADTPIRFDPRARHPFLPRTPAEFGEFQRILTPKASLLTRFTARDQIRRMREQEWIFKRRTAARRTGEEFLDGKLKTLNMPVLLLWGELDTVTPLSHGEDFHQQILQSELVILQGCGHIALFDCTSQALPEIRNFLSSTRQSGGGIRRVALIDAAK